ncbi:MAG: UDP-N-acetylmuramate dehydrogenase [Bacilli bacterium]
MIDDFNKLGIRYIANATLSNLNTYKLACRCKGLIIPKNIDELISSIKLLNKYKHCYKVLGNGSNIILSSEHLNIYIIKLNEFNNIIVNDNIISCESGTMFSSLINKALDSSLVGLEWGYGIPGTIGGCVYNNAGAYDGEISDTIIKVDALDKDGNIVSLKKEDLNFTYRSSFFKNEQDYIILKAYFQLTKGDVSLAREFIKSRMQRRKETQPLEFPSAGSVFRNPEGFYCGELIEKSNLKGFSVGGAQVSEKHANFIINKNKATGKDIIALIDVIKKTIKKDYNIDLILEQEIIK